MCIVGMAIKEQSSIFGWVILWMIPIWIVPGSGRSRAGRRGGWREISCAAAEMRRPIEYRRSVRHRRGFRYAEPGLEMADQICPDRERASILTSVGHYLPIFAHLLAKYLLKVVLKIFASRTACRWKWTSIPIFMWICQCNGFVSIGALKKEKVLVVGYF